MQARTHSVLELVTPHFSMHYTSFTSFKILEGSLSAFIRFVMLGINCPLYYTYSAR